MSLQIIPKGDVPTGITVEHRIRCLRQVYATTFLVNAGRAKAVSRALARNPNADLEELLSDKDRLRISAASEGRFWLTVLTKTKVAFRSLSMIVPLFYDEGRQALLDRMRATTEIKQLTVRQTKMRLKFEEANKLVDLVRKVEKIKDPNTRERVRDALSSNLGGLEKKLPSLPSPDETKRLSPPNPSVKHRKPTK